MTDDTDARGGNKHRRLIVARRRALADAALRAAWSSDPHRARSARLLLAELDRRNRKRGAK